MAVARTVAQRSLCDRDRVGAVVVDETNRIVDTGYNGPPAGLLVPKSSAFHDRPLDCSSWCPRSAAKMGWLLPAVTSPNVSEIVVEDHEMWLEWRGHRVPATPEKLRELGAVEITPDYSDCPSLHAEANALMFSDRRLRNGGTIYVTSGTCGSCAKLVANSGITRAVYDGLAGRTKHRDSERWYDFMRSCGLVVDVL